MRTFFCDFSLYVLLNTPNMFEYLMLNARNMFQVRKNTLIVSSDFYAYLEQTGTKITVGIK